MRVLLAVLAMAVVLFPLTADAIDVSGDQWGTWTKENSPYNVVGQIRVPPGETLIIESGVVVNFQGHYKFIVDDDATLQAIGTESDSIVFTTEDPETGWHGLRFYSASNSCQLSYCRIEYGKATGSGEDAQGGAVYCNNSSPTISDNNISNNSAGEGGGIYCNESSPAIIDNTISGNSASGQTNSPGGGIYCGGNSNPIISGNTISGNLASGGPYGPGGGIFCVGNSNPTISDNTINSNSASSRGGGIFCANSSPTIENNTINNNPAGEGGGIYCNESSPAIIDNTISGNSASGQTNSPGGGIYCGGNSNPIISGNTISGNLASGEPYGRGGGIFCVGNSNPTISQNTINSNSASSSGGGISCHSSSPTVKNTILWGDAAPSGPEIYVAVGNLPVTYCDIQGGWAGQGNINSDPLFVDPGAGDFHLQWGSPCIDTGDPNSPPDPDGTRVDMGAFYFAQGLLFSPQGFAFNLELNTISEKVLSLRNSSSRDTADFSLTSNVDWIGFLPDSGYILPDSCLDVSVTFDGSGLPLGPNEATIFLEVVTSYGHLDHEIPTVVAIFSVEYTYVSLTPDSLPIVIPPEGGSFNCWAQVYNSSDFLYFFDIWIDVTLPDGTTHGPRFKRENFRFRPHYSELRYLTQNVPAYAPPGEYSYNFKMGVFPDQVDYQDSFNFTKLEVGSPPGMARVFSWDLFGWDELSVHYVGDQGKAELVPTKYLLSQNYPNPFNAVTTVSYQLPVESHVNLEVYNMLGQKVATLVDERQAAGYCSAMWDASSVSSGLYFYRLSAGGYTETRRMMLVK